MDPKRRRPDAVAGIVCLGLLTGPVTAQPCEPLWSEEFAPTQLDKWVWDLAVFDDGSGGGPAVYASGFFALTGELPVNYVARLDDEHWFALDTGMDKPVYVLVACQDCPDGDPSLYAGGNFSHAGDVVVLNIARWDGHSWSPLGEGVGGADWAAVYALLVTDETGESGPVLYAGGYFESAGGAPASAIAEWDGVEWSPLGSGLDGSVQTLAVFDDGSGSALYAGGLFASAGGIEAENIARWDGESWSAVGGGLDGTAYALAVFDDGSGPALYVAGSFTSAGGVAAGDIARWDGVSWSPVGGSLPGELNDWIPELAVFDDGSGAGPALYVTGRIDVAGSTEAANIARWDGSTWSALGGGLEATGMALTGFVDDGTGQRLLYVGGFFESAGDVPARYIAAWDGAAWSGVQRPPAFPDDSAYVLDVATFDDGKGTHPALYVGGSFEQVHYLVTRGIARYDGHAWSALDGGVLGSVSALEVFDDGSGAGPALYVGGTFHAVGSAQIEAHSIARWDGEQWSAVGGGFGPGWVSVVALAGSVNLFGDGPALYAGGDFTEADGAAAHLVAQWDGKTWSPVGSGFYPDDARVRALAVVEGPPPLGPALYAGGSTISLDGQEFVGVARWDGDTWSPVGGGDGTVEALILFDDGRGPALYVAGDFESAGGITVNAIARWDGSRWSPVGNGVSRPGGYGGILDLEIFQGSFDEAPRLYAGGMFTLAGGGTASSIARFNGAFWTPLGDGLASEWSIPVVSALEPYDAGGTMAPGLVAAGRFTRAGAVPSHCIAKWIGCAADDLPPFTPCRYEVQPIGIQPYGMNDAATVSGYVPVGPYGYPPWKAATWSAESGSHYLNLPFGILDSGAHDINNSGRIVGWHDRDDDDLDWLAFVHDDGVTLNLGTFPGAVASSARAVNNIGQVVGTWHTTTSNNTAVAFFWEDDEMVDLGPDLGTAHSWAADINDLGQVTGWRGPGSFLSGSAYVWQNGAVIDIGFIPGGTYGNGQAINNQGQVVVTGRPEGPDVVTHTYLWQHGTWTGPIMRDDCESCQGTDINDTGVVVGRCRLAATGTWFGFVWSDGELRDLNDLLPWDWEPVIETAYAINASGQIAAYTSDGAVLLTPIAPPLGDIDGDCRVDEFDVAILLFEWGRTGSPADVDGDGTVGVLDFLILLANWTT
jgi:probable HAF family extracellular repeat protein